MYQFFRNLISLSFGVKQADVPEISVIDTKGNTITIHFKNGSKRSYIVKLEKIEGN